MNRLEIKNELAKKYDRVKRCEEKYKKYDTFTCTCFEECNCLYGKYTFKRMYYLQKKHNCQLKIEELIKKLMELET